MPILGDNNNQTANKETPCSWWCFAFLAFWRSLFR